MSSLHLIKTIEQVDENTQVVHFKDTTPSLTVTSENNILTAKCGTSSITSMKIHPLVNTYIKNRVHALNEQAKEVRAGDEVIISHGEHKGKHGFVSLVQHPTDENKYHIKGQNRESYGHFSSDQFFHKHLSEETSTVGGGAIAGAGVGTQGEPGVHRNREATLKLILDKMMKRKELN